MTEREREILEALEKTLECLEDHTEWEGSNSDEDAKREASHVINKYRYLDR